MKDRIAEALVEKYGPQTARELDHLMVELGFSSIGVTAWENAAEESERLMEDDTGRWHLTGE